MLTFLLAQSLDMTSLRSLFIIVVFLDIVEKRGTGIL
jgi:hypothetical protein